VWLFVISNIAYKKAINLEIDVIRNLSFKLKLYKYSLKLVISYAALVATFQKNSGIVCFDLRNQPPANNKMGCLLDPT